MTKKSSSRITIGLAVLVVVVGLVFYNANNKQTSTLSGMKITVYKSPTCGCCANYISYLKKYGLDVAVVNSNDMSVIKNRYGVPSDLTSCHTMTIGDYTVEGHVPIAGIEQLLKEKSSLSGIALPGMPAGSPGMPGVKTRSFPIYGFSADGQSQLYNQL